MKISENVSFALAFCCSHIASKEKPCKLVTHNDDETWEFLCGGEGHTDSDAVICSVGEILLADESVADALCIKKGFYAMREKVGGKWISRALLGDGGDEKREEN